MDISTIHFHDTQILKVIEDTENDTVTMEVDYPTNWEKNVFEKRHLVFSDALNYKVSEIPFQGSPTILDAKVVGQEGRRYCIRLETNAGHREITCASVQLAS